MIFAIATFLTKFGVNFDLARKIVSYALIAVVVLVLFLAVIVTFRSCGKKQATIDLDTLNKLNSASAAERKAELQNKVEQNAEVIRTVDNRSTIAETNVIERNTKIAETVAKADVVIEAAKQQGRDVTSEELECILTKVCE